MIRQRPLIVIAFVFLLGLQVQSNATGQDRIAPAGVAKHSNPSYSITTIRDAHTDAKPVIVVQSELDRLIDEDGGGACPISAALIAMQTVKLMAGAALHPHPHRYALQLFQEQPELKEGRIPNDRFVNLLKKVSAAGEKLDVDVETVSATNSKHTDTGPYWSQTDGPDLSVNPGELKVLSYTVTTANGVWLGRHFVLLKSMEGEQVRVLDPTRPFKDYQYGIRFHGDDAAPKAIVILDNLSRNDENEPIYELNTVFTIKIVGTRDYINNSSAASVDQIKTEIDLLAKELQAENKLTSPKEWRSRGARFGLPGLDLPTTVGGSDWSAEQMLEIFRHAGRYNLNLRDVVGGAHGRPAIKLESEFAQAAIHDLIGGRAYFAVAITEEGAGTHTKNIQSRAIRDGDGFRLTGSKLWNARLRQATHVVLYVQAANDRPGKQTAFLLPINHPGLEIVDRYAHGLTGNSFGGLNFDQMYVGPEHLIGEDGDGGDLFEEHFLYWRLMQSAAAIGCGERALEVMAERIREREAFGGPIGRFTHLQEPIGEQLTKLRMALALSREAARYFDQGNYDAAEPLVNGIKAEGVEFALEACDAAMRAHGALGYSREVDLGDRVRDLMGLRIADGTTDVMRMTVVRDAFGHDLWQMAIEDGGD
ncbi:acyl-CoA dehydrogenase family protein [Bremerella sp. T1]|uniref:acyl-CoA dehydrogenase family protein n=1 Tax=Bremerella sp. TYQ1 TaxID=3119568 RepID=UPI001CCBA387|nr:acyl-CoA dehydrogenase [Bremerella volcania]UBM36741.1 acyl-CoA dehydrogenase [Bremerella volcania]